MALLAGSGGVWGGGSVCPSSTCWVAAQTRRAPRSLRWVTEQCRHLSEGLLAVWLSGPREWDLQPSADGSAAGLSQPPPPPPRGAAAGGRGALLVLHALLTVLPSQVRAAGPWKKRNTCKSWKESCFNQNMDSLQSGGLGTRQTSS